MGIRVWKLGSLEHKIYPTKLAIETLGRILEQSTPDETLDLIWGPDIDVLELEMKEGEEIEDFITTNIEIINEDEVIIHLKRKSKCLTEKLPSSQDAQDKTEATS